MSDLEKKFKAAAGGHVHRHVADPSNVADPTDDTPTRILEATHRLIGQFGFDGTSIRDIAKDSGTNPALVYYYFGSKDGLFTALANDNADRAGAILREAANLEGSTRDRVRHFMATWMRLVCDTHRPIAPWFRRAIQDPGEHGEVLRGRVARNIGILAGILEDGICRGELRRPGVPVVTIASALMMSIAGLAMEVLLPHERTGVDISSQAAREDFVDGMLDVWFKGLETKAPPKPRAPKSGQRHRLP